MASKIPWGALFLGGVGTAAAVRTFWRPHRAVMRDGQIARCAGDPNCRKSMTIRAIGRPEVYAVASGRIVDVSERGRLVIAAANEPVLLVYSGSGMRPRVGPGKVSIGQQVADAEVLDFGVFALKRDPDGAISTVALEPAAWLSARGGGGRHLVVPQKTMRCGFKLPAPGAAMLLPVSVTTE
jgi:hypothetical protein